MTAKASVFLVQFQYAERGTPPFLVLFHRPRRPTIAHAGAVEVGSTVSQLVLHRRCRRDSARSCALCDLQLDILKRYVHADRISSTKV